MKAKPTKDIKMPRGHVHERLLQVSRGHASFSLVHGDDINC